MIGISFCLLKLMIIREATAELFLHLLLSDCQSTLFYMLHVMRNLPISSEVCDWPTASNEIYVLGAESFTSKKLLKNAKG